jgi:intein/homing endonuclease
MDPKLAATYSRLKKVRQREDLSLKPTSLLKQTYTDFDGTEQPFRHRYYQVQGILHLAAMNRFVLGDDTGLGKCVVGDTLVKTSRGLIPIRELNPGVTEPDAFASLSGVEVEVDGATVPVSRFYYGGEKPTIKVRTRSGYEIEGSQIHPVMVRRDGVDQWVKLRDLCEGDYIAIERSCDMKTHEDRVEPELPPPGQGASHERKHHVPRRMTPAFARFLGYLVAESWFNRHDFFLLSQHAEKNPEVYADMAALADEVFGIQMRPLHGDKGFSLASTQIIRFLRGVGCVVGVAKDKEVPWSVLRSSPASVREFLRGYVDAEGSTSTLGIEVSSASETLLRQVQVMLLSFGIISQRNPKMVEGRDHIYWRVQIQGDNARLFMQRIGLVSHRKIEALTPLLEGTSNPNYDVVPQAVDQVGDLRAEIYARAGRHGYKGGGVAKRWGSAFYNTLGHVRAGRRNPTYRYLERVLEIAREVGVSEMNRAYDGVATLVRRRWFYDPIEDVEDGWAEVFDIEVDDQRHAFVGNGLVCHNTLMSISGLCYVWAREPDRKVIILTNKSVLGQWALEFEKFCVPDAVQVFTGVGTPAKRQKVYKAFEHATGPTVLIMGYATARRDIKYLQAWSDYILIADECFSYHTPVTLGDGSTELIGKLVSQKASVEVLSWNPDTGEVEPKKIVNWYRKPMPGVYGRSPSQRRAVMRKMEFHWGGNVFCTEDHDFYRLDGSKTRAADLQRGDKVVHVEMFGPTDDQMQIILGSLLGDASISTPRKTWGVSFGHSDAQRDLLEFKQTVLRGLGVSELSLVEENGYSETNYWRFRMNGNSYVTRVLDEGCSLLVPYKGTNPTRKHRKQVTVEWLERVSGLGLAIWHADDGSLSTYERSDGSKGMQVRLNTQDFTREEVRLLVGWLRWRWGVQAAVKIENKRCDREKGTRKTYPYIFIGNEGAKRWFDLMPGAVPGTLHKFPEGMPVLSPAVLEITPKPVTMPDRVVNKSRWRPSNDGERYVYDIEVEGNHNYFVNGTLVSNCTAFKNPSTQTYQVVRHLSSRSSRFWALTATLIKNNLIEGYGIYSLVVPGLFPSSKNRFMNEYCMTRLQAIPGSRRQIPVIIGYRKDQIDRFREKIDPYFLARAKFDVAKELPVLQVREHKCGMTRDQERVYREALAGLFEKHTGEEVETTKLTSLIYCQQIVDHPGLVEVEGDSAKMDELFDMLTDGDLVGEKVIVFSRFRKMINKLEEVAHSKKYDLKTVRVTGNEDEDERKEAMRQFQDPNSDIQVCWITEAAKEGINLQAAKALIFYDSPWSAGDYLQCLGRMIRIGSKHDRCYAIHLVARGTIDVRVMGVLRKKMKLIEQVMGKRLKGDDMDDVFVSDDNSIDDVFSALMADARKYAA